MCIILVKVKEMFSFQQWLSGKTVRLIADSCQHLNKPSLYGGTQVDDDDVIYVIEKLEKQLTTLGFDVIELADVVYLYLNNCTRLYNVMSFILLCCIYLFENHVCSVRKTPECHCACSLPLTLYILEFV